MARERSSGLMGCVSYWGLVVLALVGSVGCAHRAPQAPGPGTVPLASFDLPKPAARPAVMQLRVLLVAYRGAKAAAPDQQRTAAEALERARMLSSMARTGETLAALVPKYSDRAGAADDLGLFKVHTNETQLFEPAVVDAAAALSVGAVSEPITTAEGYVIVERLKDPLPGPDRIAARHILIGYASSPRPVPGATRTEAEARALAERVEALVREPNADWNALAAEYTDEVAGKKTGGDLGRFGRNQMVPAFERVAFALAVGEISGVVQSPFGFHIIKRYE